MSELLAPPLPPSPSKSSSPSDVKEESIPVAVTLTVKPVEDGTKQRAKDRWAILRSALLPQSTPLPPPSQSTATATDASQSQTQAQAQNREHLRSSIHRFTGYAGLLDKVVIGSYCTPDGGINLQDANHTNSFNSSVSNNEGQVEVKIFPDALQNRKFYDIIRTHVVANDEAFHDDVDVLLVLRKLAAVYCLDHLYSDDDVNNVNGDFNGSGGDGVILTFDCTSFGVSGSHLVTSHVNTNNTDNTMNTNIGTDSKYSSNNNTNINAKNIAEIYSLSFVTSYVDSLKGYIYDVTTQTSSPSPSESESTSASLSTEYQSIFNLNRISHDVGGGYWSSSESCFNDNDNSSSDRDRAKTSAKGRGRGEGGGVAFDIVKYCIIQPSPSNNNKGVYVVTREKSQNERYTAKSKKVSLKSLVSNDIHGVDNTGQRRVWDCEVILTWFLVEQIQAECGVILGVVDYFNSDGSDRSEGGFVDVLKSHVSHSPDPSPPPQQQQQEEQEHNIPNLSPPKSKSKKKLRIIELGSGMTGLTALTLNSLSIQTPSLFDNCLFDVTLTDGHPESVFNCGVCVELSDGFSSVHVHNNGDNDDDDNGSSSSSSNSSSDKPKPKKHHQIPITTSKLLWSPEAIGETSCSELTCQQTNLYNVCIVSDCVHFTDFHNGLIATIGRLLDVGGVCILMQPERGESLNLFRKVIDGINSNCEREGEREREGSGRLFKIDVVRNFHQRIHEKHLKLIEAGRKEYDPGIHMPVLMYLTKVRGWDEGVDGGFLRGLEDLKKSGNGK